MTQKFFLVEIRNLPFFALFDFHEAATITPPRSPCKSLFQNFIYRLRIRPAAGRFHHLSYKECQIAGFAQSILLDRFWILSDNLLDDFFNFVGVRDLEEPFLFDYLLGIFAGTVYLLHNSLSNLAGYGSLLDKCDQAREHLGGDWRP